jgi:hypothetical protein
LTLPRLQWMWGKTQQVPIILVVLELTSLNTILRVLELTSLHIIITLPKLTYNVLIYQVAEHFLQADWQLKTQV